MKHKLLSFLLLTPIITSCSVGGDSESLKYTPYKSDKHFSFYAYAAPGQGYYTIDGLDYPGNVIDGKVVSYQTFEKYQEYKDCGFDTIMIQADDAYFGEDFETSHLKGLMDLAEEVGLKTIIFDNRLYVLSDKTTPIVGDGCTYETQEDLENYVRECIKDYSKHSTFEGILIKDEPSYKNLPAIGSLFKAVHAVDPSIFLQCNLFPLSNSLGATYAEGGTNDGYVQAYAQYLDNFLRLTESDYIMADSYPMKVSGGTKNIIDTNHVLTIQMLNEAAKKYNAKVYAVAQSSSWKNPGPKGPLKARACSKNDMYWQTNFYMGMGVKQISYFTYQTKKTNSTSGEYFVDGASFIKYNGEKTKLYDYVQEIHKSMQEFAPIILNFDYDSINYYKNGFPDIKFLSGVNVNKNMNHIDSVKVSADSVVLVTQMKNSVTNEYMYMFLNPQDPSLGNDKQNIKIKFKDCENVAIFNNGIQSENDASITVEFNLKPGEARFIIPFN